MGRLNLRLRVFLFFALMAFGGWAVVLGALWLGYRQSGGIVSGYVTAGIVAGFGLLALSVFVWRLFDEHVSKAVDRLAAVFRLGAAGGPALDDGAARYLGDLGPAARALRDRLDAADTATGAVVAARTEGLERQRAQLLRILSDIPVAVIVATQDHQIALYDGQAAALMAQEGPVRLDGSVFDYLDEADLRAALTSVGTSARVPVTIRGRSGGTYAGHLRVFDGDGYVVMLEPLDAGAARPIVYDFDLMDRVRPGDPEETPLRELSFVVFDSETTGLNPQADAVVQLGAVRVVNGRIIRSETFETLVDPKRPIPAAATRVHGIDDAMVAGALSFPTARAAFHAFAKGAVIVAHNAPFDMAFLHAVKTGMRFDNPVLDTVHLSAIVFGGAADHTLDAICDRLGIILPEEVRHTALGDAMATAEAFVAMLPVLEAKGLTTFGQVRAEMRRHARILKVQD
ncbi:3'-5' exonuclease [Jannaschia sp. M317]|uniref:3'-5' exonuclease n=1 Tax=Jannaschia sp. M317 TaxID=2867011 RepID=UPI0021A41973|nr:3'-5' exonuclease [Jannaschia sp. M317]UWQ17349.1 3'-5' exonuclease [Jannaschia sp. M317]